MDDAILRLFASLPLQGPGSDRDTVEVLDLVRAELPASPSIADFGCGTGRTSLTLASELPDSTVYAIDAVPLFVSDLAAEAERRGLAERIRPEVGDMLAAPIDPKTIDLIWSEGAAYAVGFETALRAWQPLLRTRGLCVVSECEWLSDDPPKLAADFWKENYPEMGDRAENVRRAEAAGFEVILDHVLSDEGWSSYYTSLIAALEGDARTTIGPDFRNAIAREIDARRRGGGSFGYTFYILRAR